MGHADKASRTGETSTGRRREGGLPGSRYGEDDKGCVVFSAGPSSQKTESAKGETDGQRSS